MIQVEEHHEPVPSDAEPMGASVSGLRLSTPASVDLGRVLALLAKPSNMPRFHPLITKVHEAPARVDGTRVIHDFEIDERIAFGFFTVPNHYRGRVVTDSRTPDQLRLSGWSKPAVRIEALHQHHDGRYVETLWFSTPRLLGGFITKQLIAAHSTLLDSLIACVAANRDQPQA